MASASELALNVPPELEAASRLKYSQLYVTKRPWLDLYGVHVRPVTPFGSTSSKPAIDTSLLHRSLPDELLFEIFARMTPYNMGKAACVCRKWRYTIRNPVFWRDACLKAWQLSGVVENFKILQSKYDGSWRKMWLLRPRIRTDGSILKKKAEERFCKSVIECRKKYKLYRSKKREKLKNLSLCAKRFGTSQALIELTSMRAFKNRGLYVSRNTYIRAGVAEWKITNPVHVVCYYRYLRFYPSGRFLYKNSSQKVKDAVKSMNFRSTKLDCIYSGHYMLSDDKVEAAFLYPGLRPTAWRTRLRLRGTSPGANNRMDLLSLVTSGVDDSEAEEDILGVVGGWQDNETHNADVPAITHQRGLTPFVFVPFEEAETSVLNLPVESMDFFVTG